MSAHSSPQIRASQNDLPAAGVPVHDWPFLVVETHLDVFGHMNNAVYLQIFEEARWALITAHGYGLKEIMQKKAGPVILEVDLAFKQELRNREEMAVRTWCARYSGKIGTLIQVMVNKRGEECARAVFIFGLFDLEKRKLIEPTPEWRVAVGI